MPNPPKQTQAKNTSNLKQQSWKTPVKPFSDSETTTKRPETPVSASETLVSGSEMTTMCHETLISASEMQTMCHENLVSALETTTMCHETPIYDSEKVGQLKSIQSIFLNHLFSVFGEATLPGAKSPRKLFKP